MTNHVIDKHGNQCWYNEKGQRHQTDGPAFLHISGSIAYWLNGKFHRTDGPAIIYSGGNKSWYVNDERYYDNKSFQSAANLSNEDMTAIVLKYGNIT